MKRTTLASHEDYLITLHQAGDNPSHTLVITFGGQPTGIAAEGFGTEFLLKHGYDTIYAAQRLGTQYQRLSISRFVEAVAEACAGRDVVCYGSSLGGYAALLYGGALNARILAAAPMFPSWPPLKRTRFADLQIEHVDLRYGSVSSKQPFILYDKHVQDDTFFIQEMVLPAYPDARLVELEHTGHAVLLPMGRAGVLKDVVLGIIERDEIIAFEMPTETCHTWTLYKGRSLVRENPNEAERLLNLSLSLRPNRPAFELLLALLLRSKRVDDARHLLATSRGFDGKPHKINKGILQLMEAAGLVSP